MQLERNLNPTLSAVYICTGVLMIFAGLVTYARLPNWAVGVLVIFGALSIIGQTAPLTHVSGRD
jgi:type IV secretory pathway VirB2 component (pilin)